MLEQKNEQNPGKSSPSVQVGTQSQSIGRGRISRKGSLVVRESPERRDKIFAGKKKNEFLA